MSASNNSGVASYLTLDEQILHHHVAKIKKDVEAYRACSRSPEDWRDLFTNHLARFTFCNSLPSAILRFVQTESINTYANAYKRNSNTPIRIHPLLLSLKETIAASETDPDICAISENDKRVTGNDLYTSPSEFPPLEIHFSGGNGTSLPPI